MEILYYNSRLVERIVDSRPGSGTHQDTTASRSHRHIRNWQLVADEIPDPDA